MVGSCGAVSTGCPSRVPGARCKGAMRSCCSVCDFMVNVVAPSSR